MSCSNSSDASRQAVRTDDIKPPQQVLDWRCIDTTQHYDRRTIFDYIDGAGEVYNAYDFRQVAVYHYQADPSSEITLEIFDMGKPDDAYGVFSHNREGESTGFGQGCERHGNTLCFWKGRYFVCVVSNDQSERAGRAVTELAATIDRQIAGSGGKPAVVRSLPSAGLHPETIRYFHLHPSLNYHYYLAEQNVLGLSLQTEAVLAQYGEGMLLLCVHYPSAEEATTGQRGLAEALGTHALSPQPVGQASGRWCTANTTGQYLVAVLEAPSSEAAADLLRAADGAYGAAK